MSTNPGYSFHVLCGSLRALAICPLLSKRVFSLDISLFAKIISVIPIISRQADTTCPPTTLRRQKACQLLELLLHPFSPSQYVLVEFFYHYCRILHYLKRLKPQIVSPQYLFTYFVPVMLPTLKCF